MAGVVSHKVPVVTIEAFVCLQDYVFNLASKVASNLINVKTDVVSWCFVSKVAGCAVWHDTVDVQVDMVVPREAEADSVVIGNPSSLLSYSHFSHCPVFASSV